ncbi:fimbrial biogenesis chaperone [Pseudomonas citronellolis]|uniref:fimbrial biogenesis chaperone n=1 Tax=Pseudomonas citronellolis TaxID=53408 RepID=UPI0023E3A8DB|nr:fimbria/pilus periplasmic chaperone [Pseudomonas citronellolis]MDF3931450.1 fimbria/pilus periplasmic chaperone [Pseudomonas citronellolis]
MKRGAVFAFALALVAPWAQASVVLGGTRLVYPAGEREVTLQLQNPERVPRLVQAWVDGGDPESRPDNADAPFLVTPPILRMDAGKGVALRVMFTHQAVLPQDRESLFWLNVMDIPPQPQAGESNYLQLAYRSRIKLLFRPPGLSGSPAGAAESLSWRLLPDGRGGALLRASNLSAYHVSLDQMLLQDGGRRGVADGGMVAPGASTDFPLQGMGAQASASARVRYRWIDDYGALREREVPLGR